MCAGSGWTHRASMAAQIADHHSSRVDTFLNCPLKKEVDTSKDDTLISSRGELRPLTPAFLAIRCRHIACRLLTGSIISSFWRDTPHDRMIRGSLEERIYG
jgi:hypothetical protein